MARKTTTKKARKKTVSKVTVKRTKGTTRKATKSAKKTKTTKSAKTTKKAKKAKIVSSTKVKKTTTKKQAKPKRTRATAKLPKAKKAKAAGTKVKRAHRQSVEPPSSAATSSPMQPTKTANPIPRKDLEEFRAMLLDKRAQLLGDVDTLSDEALKGSRKESAGDLSSMPIHMADLGTDNYELEFTLGLIEGGHALLQEINEALERIRQGTYGVCLATGRSIGKARLRAQPWAKYCYEYVLAQETGK